MSRRKRDRRDGEDDERPPICPACGVTQGMIVVASNDMRFVCLECGFSDESN